MAIADRYAEGGVIISNNHVSFLKDGHEVAKIDFSNKKTRERFTRVARYRWEFLRRNLKYQKYFSENFEPHDMFNNFLGKKKLPKKELNKFSFLGYVSKTPLNPSFSFDDLFAKFDYSKPNALILSEFLYLCSDFIDEYRIKTTLIPVRKHFYTGKNLYLQKLPNNNGYCFLSRLDDIRLKEINDLDDMNSPPYLNFGYLNSKHGKPLNKQLENVQHFDNITLEINLNSRMEDIRNEAMRIIRTYKTFYKQPKKQNRSQTDDLYNIYIDAWDMEHKGINRNEIAEQIAKKYKYHYTHQSVYDLLKSCRKLIEGEFKNII